MSSRFLARVMQLVAVSCFVALLIPGAGAATPAPATRAASQTPATGAACVVVLECAGVTQKTVPDAEGKFVFHDVPAGSCTVSAVPTSPDAAAEASSSVKHTDVAAPRDAASGMATGKRQHPPRFQVSVDGQPEAGKAAATDEVSHNSVHVVVAEKRKEFTGHVTLIK